MKIRDVFEKEYCEAVKRPKISDQRGQDLFNSATSRITDSTSALTEYNGADEKRLGSTKEQHEAAYSYLALGFRLIDDSSILVQLGGKSFSPAEVFHFAGAAFREIGQLNRAADAYWRAGVVGTHQEKINAFSVRSLTRAKSCYKEIGQTDSSDRMHKLEWEARRGLSSGAMRAFLTFWKTTTFYGTSFSRWTLCVIIFLIVFAGFYEFLHRYNLISQEQPWKFGITPIYYCVVTTATVGYGDFVPRHPIAQVVVMINVLLGYFFLGIGTTVLGRKILNL